MIVKNFGQLAKSKERTLALNLVDTGLEAVDTKKVIRETVSKSDDEIRIGNETFALNEIERLFIVGVGKCSLSAGEALEEILGDSISGGVIIDVREGELKHIHTVSGDHPFPSEKNVGATQEIIKLLSDATEKDFVIFIVSGGGSTLLCNPTEMTCLEEGEILKFLYGAGIGIRKINTVRKHLSSARGGYLAKYAYPARAVALIFSDVPGDDLEFIASGPTIKDTTTVSDAEKIIEECGLVEKTGVKASLIETPKEDKYFESIKNVLVVSNKIALTAMAERARSEGYNPEIITTTFEGEAKHFAVDVVKRLRGAKSGAVHLYGGESTVTVRHVGRGGRNLELALASLESIQDDELVLAVSSDGRDNTDFAGAISDMITKINASELKLNAKECVDGNCSYDFFKKTGDYIKTGDTGRNIADIVIGIKS